MIALWHRLPPQFEDQLHRCAGLASAYHFDDGHDDVLRAADALERHDLRGVFFVISGAVGTDGFATAAQLHELVERGHEIGNHTRSHRTLTEIPLAEARREVAMAQADLAGLVGVSPRRFAWPHGRHNPELDAMVDTFGFVEVRDISNVVRHAARKSVADIVALFT